MRTLFENARLADGRTVDVEVVDGFISLVCDAGSAAAAEGTSVLDQAGWLFLPSMAEPHAHLDKALTADRVRNQTGDLMGAIDAWTIAADAGQFTHDDIVSRSTAAMELLLVHGVTAVRTHVNVAGGEAGASSVIAVREAAASFAGMLDIQIVALTHCPITGDDGAENRAGLVAAVEAGVDVIGGCPHLEPDLSKAPEVIRHALEVATDAGVGVDLHMDETLDPDVMFLPELARQVIDSGFQYSVAASHCVSLGMQSPQRQAEVAAIVAEAGISVFPLPQTNLFLQGREHPSATPRGLTAINALESAGVTVGAGADNVQDPFNMVGRSDPLETAAMMVMAGHRMPDRAYEMVSNEVRKAIGLVPVGFSPGDPADFVAIDAPSVRGAIADAPMSRRVYRRGVLVAEARQEVVVYRPSGS